MFCIFILLAIVGGIGIFICALEVFEQAHIRRINRKRGRR